MNKLFFRILLAPVFLLTGLGTCVGQETYNIDNSHTSIIFAISHYNLSFTYGRFNNVGGSFVWNENVPAASSFEFVIEAASIDTNDKGRDQHLRSPDFFNVEEHKEIKFSSTKIEKVDETYNLTGDMTILGVTKEIVIPLRLVGIGKGPFGKERAGFFGKFLLKRSDFGMDKMLQSVGDKISVTFSFEGIKQ